MKTSKSRAPPHSVRRGWPHPTSSRLSANAFLERSRSNDEHRAVLIGAFRPLPARTLTKRELASGFASAAKTLNFVVAAWKTEARFRTDFLPFVNQFLLKLLHWTADELQGPADTAAKVRHKLDRRDPKLTAALSTHLAAQRAGIKPPSDGELAALAVLHGPTEDGGGPGERPTPDDRQRRTYWRTTRRRAQKLARQVGEGIQEVHPQFLESVLADELRHLGREKEYREAKANLERELAELPAAPLKAKGGTKTRAK